MSIIVFLLFFSAIASLFIGVVTEGHSYASFCASEHINRLYMEDIELANDERSLKTVSRSMALFEGRNNG